MSRNFWILLAIGILASTGCRNRYNNPYGGGLFTGTPTIAAPGTYSLNIPSLASNQPYYVPGQSNSAVVETLDPRVPPSANNNYPAQLNGWRPSPDNSGTSNFNTGQSVLAASNVNNGYSVPPGYRSASNTAMPGSGISYTDSTNYQSTGIDERTDRTRLAATDASNVRAPALNNPTTGAPQFTQFQNSDPRYSATFNAPNSGRTNNSPLNNQINPVVGNGARGGIANQGPVGTGQGGYRATPYFTSPYARSSPSVLAQSTTNFDPNGNGSQVGWRDRELGSESLNR